MGVGGCEGGGERGGGEGGVGGGVGVGGGGGGYVRPGRAGPVGPFLTVSCTIHALRKPP